MYLQKQIFKTFVLSFRKDQNLVSGIMRKQR